MVCDVDGICWHALAAGSVSDAVRNGVACDVDGICWHALAAGSVSDAVRNGVAVWYMMSMVSVGTLWLQVA